MEDHFHKADPPETMPDQEGVPVLLTVTGKQTDPDGSTQENTSVYRAVCRNKEDGFFFSYFDEGTKVNLFLSRGSAWMQRGTVRSARMVFDPSVPSTRCSYETDYGIIPMVIRTEGISVMAGGLRRKSVESRKSITDDRDGNRDSSISGNRSGDFCRAARSLQARIRYTLVMDREYELKCSVTIKTQQIV
ncbi:MAG: DUF1934 domain-containing protein [Lachnospiraceae bacterium]|nr:DUF1934 domain-containing protein [Lachnospiraceae bacterium]